MSDMDKNKPVIAAQDLHLSLMSEAGEVHILRGLNLTINEGETVAIVGPSGSGKSTLLMVLAGLEQPTSGGVQIAGTDISGLDEDALALFRRDHIGIVFQSFHLIPTMTALENVAVPLELAGVKDAFDQAAKELEFVGLGHRLTHYPTQLSGGEQQRVAMARAVVSGPKILLGDEPTGNLDTKTGSEIVDAMFDLHDRAGATLVLITHDEGLARQCDRIIRLADGLIVGDEAGEGRSKAA